MSPRELKVHAGTANAPPFNQDPGVVRSPTPERVNAVARVPLIDYLENLTAALAREGIEVRGALTRRSSPTAALTMTPSTSGEGDAAFVAHFEIATTDNDGRPFSLPLIVALLRDLYNQFGGATFREQAGIWRSSDGVCFADISIGVEVWTADRPRLVAFVERVRRTLRQKEIAVRIERAEFVAVSDAEHAA